MIKNSGLVQIPPIMLGEMAKWVTSSISVSFVTSLLYSPKNPERDQLVQKWDKRNVLHLERHESLKKKFSINLERWRYLPKIKNLDLIEQFNNGKVSILFTGNGSAWFTGEGRLELQEPSLNTLEYLMDFKKYKDADEYLEDVYLDTLEAFKHEATHMAQTFLEIGIMGKQNPGWDRKPGPGMPSKKIMNPAISQNSLSRHNEIDDNSHELDDAEFYTRLLDEITVFRKKYKTLSRADRKEKALYWIGERKTTDDYSVSVWMKFLRKKSPLKWKKAVKEFLKKVL